ncbi:hypothetical protein [Corynebacterium lizhenjunii]|uniref:hypothetical protein n=1 Tax=Corynebacterium lizhenjunii TaxID=2709394 RepID=UPI0013ED097A|nr:hypothetical protein [Corynebacterium lizhenjunii]
MSVRVVINRQAVGSLLLSDGVRDEVTRHTEAVQARAGINYGSSVRRIGDRPQGIVYTDNFKARVDNGRNNTLLKAVGG